TLIPTPPIPTSITTVLADLLAPSGANTQKPCQSNKTDRIEQNSDKTQPMAEKAKQNTQILETSLRDLVLPKALTVEPSRPSAVSPATIDFTLTPETDDRKIDMETITPLVM